MKNRLKYSAVLSLILFGLFGCGDALKYDESVEMTESVPEQTEFAVDNTEAEPGAEETSAYHRGNKIIRTADIRFMTEDISESTEKIEKAVKKYGGFVGNASLTSNNTETEQIMTIRVPSENFEVLVKEIEKESAFLNYKNIKAEDITEQFTDWEAYLRNDKAEEEQYLEILRTQKSADDIQRVKTKIREIREEIELKTARLNRMKDQIRYSTINLEVYQITEYREIPDAYEKKYSDRLNEGFSTGLSIVKALFLVIVYAWPFLLIVATVLIFLTRKGYFRKKKS